MLGILLVVWGSCARSSACGGRWSWASPQLGQMLWGVAGLIGGPLVMLILYVCLFREAPESAQR